MPIPDFQLFHIMCSPSINLFKLMDTHYNLMLYRGAEAVETF